MLCLHINWLSKKDSSNSSEVHFNDLFMHVSVSQLDRLQVSDTLCSVMKALFYSAKREFERVRSCYLCTIQTFSPHTPFFFYNWAHKLESVSRGLILSKPPYFCLESSNHTISLYRFIWFIFSAFSHTFRLPLHVILKIYSVLLQSIWNSIWKKDHTHTHKTAAGKRNLSLNVSQRRQCVLSVYFIFSNPLKYLFLLRSWQWFVPLLTEVN